MSPLTLTPIIHVALLAYLYVRSGVPADDRYRIEANPDGSGHFLAYPDMVPLPLRDVQHRRDENGQWVEVVMEWDGDRFHQVMPTAGDYREGGV